MKENESTGVIDEMDLLDKSWNFWKKWSLRVGRPFGFDIRIHFLASLGMVLMYSDLRTYLKLSQIFIAFLGIALSFLIHEMAHALTAKAFRREVKGLILIPPLLAATFARLDPEKHLQNIVIYASGPLSNIVCGVGLMLYYEKIRVYILGFLVSDYVFDISTAFFTYLLPRFLKAINLSIGILNIIPFYPLDGGRILMDLLMSFKLKEKKAGLITFLAGVISFAGLISFAILSRDYITPIFAVVLLCISFLVLIKEKN